MAVTMAIKAMMPIPMIPTVNVVRVPGHEWTAGPPTPCHATTSSGMPWLKGISVWTLTSVREEVARSGIGTHF